jgi:hypothetical protein
MKSVCFDCLSFYSTGCTNAEKYILKETMLCLIVNMVLVQNRFKVFVTRFDIKSRLLSFDKAFVMATNKGGESSSWNK